MDTITMKNLNEVVFEGVSLNVIKNVNLPGENAPDDKVKLEINVVWDGNKLGRAIKNASEVEAKNWYNNHRPSSDEKIMTSAECKRRIDFLRAVSSAPILVTASETGADKVTDLSITQLENIIASGNEAQVKFAESKLGEKTAEGDKARDALKRLNERADKNRHNKVGKVAK